MHYMGTSDNSSGKSLVELGPGAGSGVERIKLESRNLRGRLADDLKDSSTPTLSAGQEQLIKFHGIYQQEDRDARQARKAAGMAKSYNFMVRSRIPGGAVTPEQYLTHDDLAGRFANNTIRITTRQGFQLHGVLKGDLQPTIRSINDALLSTLAACGDVNRNVMACPAPVTSRLHGQVQEIAHKLAMHLAPKSGAYHEIWIDGESVATLETPQDEVEPIYGETYLPRKFKIGVAFPGDNCVDIYTQDVGLVAELDEGELVGFNLVIGGGMGMTHGKTETYPRLATPLCFAKPEEVVEIVEAIVTVQRDFGDRTNRKHARMKYLVEERGIDWFKAEVERRLERSLSAAKPVEWHGVDDHLGWHEQADGRLFLGLWIENGRIKDTPTIRLRSGLRRLVETFSPGIRLTGQQNILLTDIEPGDRAAVEALLAEYGIASDPEAAGGVRRHALSCPALPTCGLALSDAERALPDLVRQVERDMAELGMSGDQLSIRMTGCPNGCARPYMGDIGLVGKTRDVYNVYLGGDWANTRMNTLFAPSVRLEDLAATIKPLLILWRDEREDDESFGDYVHRVGPDYVRSEETESQSA
jgi:sulfite reductase (ferredoxin)